MARSKLQDLKVRDVMSADPVTAGPDDSLGDVLGKMKRFDIHEIPILRGKVLAGLVTMAGIMRRKGVPAETNASTLVQPAPHVSPEEDLPSCAEQMLTGGFRALPVTEGKRLVGIVSRTDIARAIAERNGFEDVPLRTVMTPSPLTVDEDETVERAIRAMQELGERSIPVVDKNRRLVGILGHKDVADLFARPKSRQQTGDAAGEKVHLGVQVKGVMRYPVITLGPEASVAHAARLLLEHGISSVVVVEREEPVGIVTKLDLVELLAGMRERAELLVQISGLEEQQPSVYDDLYEIIRKGMRKVSEVVTPRTLTVHVQEYKAEGDRSKWSLRARFTTSHRMYYLNHFDWDLGTAMAGLMDLLERQILKEKERRVTERKRPHGT